MLPAFRPQLHPLDELAQAVAIGLGPSANWRQCRAAFDAKNLPGELSGLARDLRAARGANEAQILIAIDQGEELVGGADTKETEQFLKVLNSLLDERLPFLAIMTLRSDLLGMFQQLPDLAAPFEQFSLKPTPLERMRDIIEGPAKVAGITVDNALVTAATADAKTDDALPLLAFALRELFDRFAATGRLTAEAYQALGDSQAKLSPLENSVRRKAEEVLGAAKPSPEDLQALKEAFIPAMVRVNAEGEYVRRPARMDSLSPRAGPLIERLVKARLLIIRQEQDTSMVEVSHEALLRKWPLLRGWLDEEREFLIGKNQLEHDLLDWERASPDQKTDALLSGLKLTRARTWLAANPLQLSASERKFIQASIAHFEAEAARRERARRRVVRGSVAATAVLAVVAGIALQQRRAEETLRLTETWKVLAFEAPRQSDLERDDDLSVLLARQADLVRKRLTDQPTGLTDYSLYSVFPTQQFRHVLRGHDAAVMTVAFSPDGWRLASGGWDRTVRVWDLRQPQASAQILATLPGGVWDVTFSPDGQRLAAGSDDGTIHVWDLRQPQSTPILLSGHQDHVQSVAFSPDGQRLASASADTTIRLWDLNHPQDAPQILQGHQGAVWSVGFDPSGERLVSGGDDGSVDVWNLRNVASHPLVLKEHREAVRSVTFNADGTKIASGSTDKAIVVWDLRHSQPDPIRLLGNNGPVWSVAFSHDGGRLASGDADSIIRIWNLADPNSAPDSLAAGHTGDVRSVAFSPDGKRLASASEDMTIRVWEMSTPISEFVVLKGHKGAVNTVAFDPSGEKLASAGDDSTIRIWNPHQPNAPPVVLAGNTGSVWSLAFSSDGRLASGGADKAVRIWDLGKADAGPAVLWGHRATVWSVAFSPDGRSVASGSADGTIRIWNLSQSGAPPVVLSRGNPVASEASGDRPCFSALVLANHPNDIYSVAFDPRGHELASGSADTTVSIWDLDNKQAPPLVLAGHQDYVCSVAFSPDGNMLASGSGDNTVRIWSLPRSGRGTGQLSGDPQVLSGHSGDVLSVAFSRDGGKFASSGEDKTIRIWDMHELQAGSLVLTGQGMISSVAFSPDGNLLASGSVDGTIRLWSQPDSLADVVCSIVWRNLTMEEWRLYVGEGMSYERTCPNLPSGAGAPANAPPATK